MRPRTSLRRTLAFSALVFAATLLGAGLTSSVARAATYNGYFTFTKNADDPTNSRLTWEVFRTDLAPKRLVERKSWRAGSGNGTKNSCTRNAGWLPDGKYGGTYYPAYDGSLIKGPVFYLSDTRCSAGTPRTQLFIHSEMTAGGGQNCRFERWCWEGDKDYYSDGCIKLRPADMHAAAAAFDRWYDQGPDPRKNRRYSELLYVQ